MVVAFFGAKLQGVTAGNALQAVGGGFETIVVVVPVAVRAGGVGGGLPSDVTDDFLPLVALHPDGTVDQVHFQRAGLVGVAERDDELFLPVTLGGSRGESDSSSQAQYQQ